MKKPSYKILRMRGVVDLTSYPRSTVYLKIKNGLLPRPVALGGPNKGWPEEEIEAINAARIAGKSEVFIRALVKQLESSRPQYADNALIERFSSEYKTGQ